MSAVVLPPLNLYSLSLLLLPLLLPCVQDIRGLAEIPRLTLAASGVEWTDDRLTFSRNADGSFNRGDVRTHGTAQHRTGRNTRQASEQEALLATRVTTGNVSSTAWIRSDSTRPTSRLLV